MTAPHEGDELGAIRERTRKTRDVINGAAQRQNYVVASPALLDREALLRAVDAAIAVGGEKAQKAILDALQKR